MKREEKDGNNGVKMRSNSMTVGDEEKKSVGKVVCN